LQLQIFEGKEFQMVVKPFLVIAVTSFHFAVVPRGSGANQLVLDVTGAAEEIEWMDPSCFCKVRKFAAVVRLDHFGSISKESDGSLNEV
jgi:hypothetical protein